VKKDNEEAEKAKELAKQRMEKKLYRQYLLSQAKTNPKYAQVLNHAESNIAKGIFFMQGLTTDSSG
jgi:hypothetical protein